MKHTKQEYSSDVKAVKMIRLSPDYWLRLLGATAPASPSANGFNGQTPWQVVGNRPEMTDYSPEAWLKLLGGAANNGSGPQANLTSSPAQEQQFATEFWLRLLGDRP
jgi:hypothetical protein